MADPIGAKPGQSSSTGLSNSGSEKARDTYKYKKSKADSLKNLALAKNLESHSLDGSVHKCDSKDSLKKRKWSECQNPEIQPPGYYGRDISTPRRSSYGENDRCSNRSGMIKKEEASNGKHHGMPSGLDYQEKDVHNVSGATIKAKIRDSDFVTHQDTDVTADPLGQANQYVFRTENSDQGLNNERRNSSQFQNNGSTSKDEKVLLSQHKEKNHEELTSGRNKFEDKSGASSDGVQQGSKKDSFGKLLNENIKGDIQTKFGDGAEVKLDVISSLDKRQAALVEMMRDRLGSLLLTKLSKLKYLRKGNHT
ncbi:hypothetical protein HAX54_046536 [Datura stramonium]|uniref:Uncharacterized protein n=1 Tax=Datura stramonium TaxID=4076 RepID=A0ABS8WKV4_DATST|nr:hypothetical protein [Datura stramonium]